MGRIRKSGGYRQLRSFQTSTIIYDATYWFCEEFLNPRSRTIDQMVQSARSGRQNIAEGSRASATSSQTELRLMNVARSSLEELLLDYEDYIRQRHQVQWEKDSPQALQVREVAEDHRDTISELTARQRYTLYTEWLDHENSFIRANALICLTHQVNYLLDQQIAALEKEFIEDGGYSESLASERLRYRSDRSDQTDRDNFPPCPKCGKPMVLRTAKTGPNEGKSFLGCSGYPECKGAKNL